MDIIAFVALPFLAFLGAWTSRQFRRAGATSLVFVPPLVSFTVGWGWMAVAKHTKLSLAAAQMAFDTTYVLSYFVSFLILGEVVVAKQAVGAILALVGIVLLVK